MQNKPSFTIIFTWYVKMLAKEPPPAVVSEVDIMSKFAQRSEFITDLIIIFQTLPISVCWQISKYLLNPFLHYKRITFVLESENNQLALIYDNKEVVAVSFLDPASALGCKDAMQHDDMYTVLDIFIKSQLIFTCRESVQSTIDEIKVGQYWFQCELSINLIPCLRDPMDSACVRFSLRHSNGQAVKYEIAGYDYYNAPLIYYPTKRNVIKEITEHIRACNNCNDSHRFTRLTEMVTYLKSIDDAPGKDLTKYIEDEVIRLAATKIQAVFKNHLAIGGSDAATEAVC